MNRSTKYKTHTQPTQRAELPVPIRNTCNNWLNLASGVTVWCLLLQLVSTKGVFWLSWARTIHASMSILSQSFWQLQHQSVSDTSPPTITCFFSRKREKRPDVRHRQHQVHLSALPLYQVKLSLLFTGLPFARAEISQWDAWGPAFWG